MGGVGQGIEFLRQQREKRGYGSSTTREYMKGFYLQDDQDRARFFFGTDGDACVNRGYHNLTVPGRGGKKDWTKEIVCPRTIFGPTTPDGDDSAPCAHCDGGDAPWLKPAYFVYVDYIDHSTPGEGRQQGKRGNLVVYREPIKEVRLWLAKTKDSPKIADKFGEFGTLLDAEFYFTRFGARGQQGTSYGLERGQVGRPPEVTAAIDAQPPLADIVARDFADRVPQRTVVNANASQMATFSDPGPDYQQGDDSADLIDFG